MDSLDFPDPPTDSSIQEARRTLQAHRLQLSHLSERISSAEDALAQIVADRTRAIQEMQREQDALDERVMQTLAYISPIRRLPHELLRHIFMFNFDNHPCCAWVLASVCVSWRRLALSIPRLWSKIRLVTNQSASPDTIRLWLERTGDRVPLDIEIYLRVNGISADPPVRAPISSPNWIPSPPSPPPHYILPHPPPGTTILLPPAQTPIIVPQSPSHHDPWGSPPPSSPRGSPQIQRNTHWGHVAIFYLIEQMHRWERFVFRFDRQFSSIAALKSINGEAPMLREFEISCAEMLYESGWTWLPCATPSASFGLSKLQSLMLHHVPFKWSSPIFKTDLRSLNLRSLPSIQLSLDRILHIITSNLHLERLSLHFSVVQPAVLPLQTTSLAKLRELSLGGHANMTALADALIVPALDVLSLDIEIRDSIEDVITNLLQRSNNPAITDLTVSYGNPTSSTLYYGPGIMLWGFLAEMDYIHSLSVGGMNLESFLVALGTPEDELAHWMCPNLRSLTLKNCHTHPDGIAKLVQLIDARNPVTGSATTVNGVTPSKLRYVELSNCTWVGQDVLEWLRVRVDEVNCVEPSYGRSL